MTYKILLYEYIPTQNLLSYESKKSAKKIKHNRFDADYRETDITYIIGWVFGAVLDTKDFSLLFGSYSGFDTIVKLHFVSIHISNVKFRLNF